LGKSRRGWYEREETEKVTLDWVKTHCRLTNREMELLEIIRDRKLVKRDHLEIISPSYRKAGDNRTEILNRSIRKLFRSMCIDKVHETRELGKGGNNPCTVALDRGGSVILGISHKRRILHRKEGGYLRRVLPTNFRHINGVNQLEVETIILLEEIGGEILEWTHEKPQELHYSQEKVVVIPDVRVELKLREKPFYAFIEYDTGSEDRRNTTDFPTIREKLLKYKRYKMSKLWDTPYFPVMLFVTEDDKRIPYVNKKLKELGLEGWGIYHENYTEFMERLAKLV
jgi:predicted HTH transcriptional regulator